VESVSGMTTHSLNWVCRASSIGLLMAIAANPAGGQSHGKLTGTVTDPSGRPVPRANILVRYPATLIERTVTTNDEGIYELPALLVGTYQIEVHAKGFRPYIVQALIVDVGTTLVMDVRLEVGDVPQQINVASRLAPIDAASTSVGHLVDARSAQELPLNGRYFLDLAVLTPGSVIPANGFSTTPFRGLGTLAINTAGNREETVNYLLNGITLNDLVFSTIQFQPSISTVQEFRIDNSTFSAEYGQNSGAVVNVATRSGGAEYHGELFEFLRNDALDARNFFTLNSSRPPPFKRNQFGGSFGGPIVKKKAYFLASYEGLRQSQKSDLNSLVLSDSERASATNPVITKLIDLIPRSNLVDSSGTPRYVGSGPAPVNNDQWTLDVSYFLNKSDWLHGYYSFDLTKTVEPTMRGNTIPGFGFIQLPRRQFFSLNETHTFGARINETRMGMNRISSTTSPYAQLNPAAFGIRNGITQPVGLPQISISGGALNFGGPSAFPSGRGDTTLVVADTFSCICGRHSLAIGVEYRQFLNNNFRLGTGAFTYPSVAAFLADAANSFSITLGSQSSSIAQGALGAFVQSNYKWRPNLTLELGLRYEWNMTPEERFDRFVVFDPGSASLKRVGASGEIYRQNNKNLQPRLGIAWDPFKDGKTSVRAAYAILVDQPMTSLVTPTAANPPLAIPLAVTGTIRLENAADLAQAVGLAPATVDHGFHNASLQSWNVNVQRALSNGASVMAGYFGSKGSNLILRRNINQPVAGARPYLAVSESSAILPGQPLGNITQAEGTGNSNYNGLWISATQSLARGLQLSASYTWSKSLDYNSLSTQGIVVQNSYQIRGDRGVSDFDARQRVVVRALYDLPFRGNRMAGGWQVAAIMQAQSGSPVNVVTNIATVNGVAGTLRPDVVGPVRVIGSVDRWFDTSVFIPVSRFGDLGRNVIFGPGFSNADFSLMKTTVVAERFHIQFRCEVFDLFNHANFGQPGNVVGTPGFGRITATRFPTGESGSSRQIQFGVKMIL
jgi:hypothetical protein